METKINQELPFSITGHLLIKDDLGNIHVDKHNAIHPQNMARIIARALANEKNFFIHRIAFGNGGSVIDAAQQVTYRPPNDGLPPDLQEWRSRLYNETYSEIIDDSNVNIGTDPGSVGPGGTRAGGGAVPVDDPPTIEHVSGPGARSRELGLLSQVIITSVLNPNEPRGQLLSDLDPNPTSSGDPVENTEGIFVFDEVGLYTTGAPGGATSGFQQIDLGEERNSQHSSGLIPSRKYTFKVKVNNGTTQTVDFTTPSSGSGSLGEITYGDICEAINSQSSSWGTPQLNGAIITITDLTGGSYPSIANANTFGYLQVQSLSTGTTSTILITAGTTNGSPITINMLDALEGGGIPGTLTAVPGVSAGVQNNPVNYSLERERLLTHLTFSPVLKSKNRVMSITYTLNISVARSN